MTEIYMEQVGNRYTLVAQGHATGSPETCAAISGVIYALAGYLRNRGEEPWCWLVESGEVWLEWSGGEEAQAAYDLCLIGLMQIARAQPEFVRVVED